MASALEWDTWWFFRLTQNFLGYATIALPGAFMVYYLKKSKYLESRKNHCIWNCLRMFIYGSDESSLDGELPLTFTSRSSQSSIYKTAILLMFCFIGLQVSYLTWGILQEKIMTQEYRSVSGKSKKFTDSQFLVFVNRVLAFIFAGTYLLISKQPQHRAPIYKYSYCSFSNIMSSWCQYEALKYVSFPTQVLAKASKIIPVMLMGKVVSKRVYKYHEYATAAGISFGMILFLWSRGEKPDSKLATVTSVSGVIILLAYMVSDSFTSNWQNELFHQYHMSSVQMMCGVNFFSCIFTAMSLLQLNGFYYSFSFFIEFPNFFFDCILLSMCSAIGQLFIFYTISKFGPVAFTIMMTVRQALAILLSCLIYHHTLTLSSLIGIVIVFGAVFLSIYLKYRAKLKAKATLSPNDQV